MSTTDNIISFLRLIKSEIYGKKSNAFMQGLGGKLFGAIWEKGSGIEYWTGLGKGGEPRKRKDGVTEAWISL